MKSIKTKKAPAALGPYSQAVLKNGILFISGQLGIDPETGKLVDSFADQAKQVFYNLKNILLAADMSFKNVLKVTIYVDDLENFPILNDIYNSYFEEPYPARETVEVSKLPANGAIEISLIAMA